MITFFSSSRRRPRASSSLAAVVLRGDGSPTTTSSSCWLTTLLSHHHHHHPKNSLQAAGLASITTTHDSSSIVNKCRFTGSSSISIEHEKQQRRFLSSSSQPSPATPTPPIWETEEDEEEEETSGSKEDSTSKRRTWDESYELLLEYYKEHGDANVPGSYKKDPKLGRWVESQRKHKSRIQPDRLAKLNALSLNWDGASHQKLQKEKKWFEMFELLQEFYDREGHCLVPKSYKENPSLGGWVLYQRRQYTKGQLCQNRITKLESIDFVWRIKPFKRGQPNNERWYKKFEQLVEFQQQFGHCRVPENYQANKSLAVWVSTQRHQYAEGILDPQRQQQLDSIGFTWNFHQIFNTAWKNKYNQLKELQEQMQKELKGSSNESRGDNEEGEEDVIIVEVQSKDDDDVTNNSNNNNSIADNNYNDDGNNNKQQQQLADEEVGGGSGGGKRRTWAHFQKQEELYTWEIHQQLLFEKGTLDKQRIAMLEEIGYWESLGLSSTK